MFNLKISMTFLIILTGLTLIGCSEQESEATLRVPASGNENIDEMVVQDDQGNVVGDLDEGSNNAKDFVIKAKQWEFKPSVITVNEGDMVRLLITSEDVTHGFRLPEFGVSEILKSGQTVNIEFIADKKGTFSFFCTVSCGAGHFDMKGTLIVI